MAKTDNKANGHVPSDNSSSKNEDSYWEDSSGNAFFESSQQAKLPGYIGQTVLSVLVFVMGASMRGT